MTKALAVHDGYLRFRRAGRGMIAAFILMAVAGAPARGQQLFEIWPTHSQVEFSVPFMGLTSVRGQFEDYVGALSYDSSDVARSSVTVVLRTASLHTGNDPRDRHLKSDDFFDVARYPVLMFQSDRIERTQDGFAATGRLLIHGVSRIVTLPFVIRHPLRHEPNGVDYLGFDARIRIDWRDFGIPATSRHNGWFDPARMLVNDSVDVTISIEAEHRHVSEIHYPMLDAHLERVAAGGSAAIERGVAEARAKGADSLRAFVRGLADAADALLERGDVSRALAAHRAHVAATNDDPDAMVRLGLAYRAAGDRVRADECLRSVLARDPYNAAALETLRRSSP